MKKISDRIFLGIISGIIGGIPGRLLNALEYRLALTDFKYGQLASSLFLPPRNINNSKARIVGSIANHTGIALIGVLITYLLSITGRDKAILKGLGISSSAWLFVYGLVARIGLPIKTKRPLSPILSFIDHATLGIFTALIVSKIGDASLFPDTHNTNGKKLPINGMEGSE
ncbi:MAG: hypothetical protein ACOYVD_12370 [Bacillota bacterium]